jgi:AraC-like DNA-binding protein
MLTEGVDANNAGYSVGYESITQFNREYKRLFGEPPGKNVKRLLTR